jgi:hypothetical protein
MAQNAGERAQGDEQIPFEIWHTATFNDSEAV